MGFIDEFDVLIGSIHIANRILSNTAVDKLGHGVRKAARLVSPCDKL